VTVAQVARYLKRDRTVVTRGLREAADLSYVTNREDKPGRAARYRLGPDKLPEDKPALPDGLPKDACAPAQGAHLSQQVSEGCAGVRVCTGDGRETLPEVLESPPHEPREGDSDDGLAEWSA
jgi:hypothetical protein